MNFDRDRGVVDRNVVERIYGNHKISMGWITQVCFQISCCNRAFTIPQVDTVYGIRTVLHVGVCHKKNERLVNFNVSVRMIQNWGEWFHLFLYANYASTTQSYSHFIGCWNYDALFT